MCEHNFIVTSWKISGHSESAQELLCQKCMCVLDYSEIGLCRKDNNLRTDKCQKTGRAILGASEVVAKETVNGSHDVGSVG